MTNLKKYYPILRTKEQVRESISKNYDVNRIHIQICSENVSGYKSGVSSVFYLHPS